MLYMVGKGMVQLENVQSLVWKLLFVVSPEIKELRVHKSVKTRPPRKKERPSAAQANFLF